MQDAVPRVAGIAIIRAARGKVAYLLLIFAPAHSASTTNIFMPEAVLLNGSSVKQHDGLIKN